MPEIIIKIYAVAVINRDATIKNSAILSSEGVHFVFGGLAMVIITKTFWQLYLPFICWVLLYWISLENEEKLLDSLVGS